MCVCARAHVEHHQEFTLEERPEGRGAIKKWQRQTFLVHHRGNRNDTAPVCMLCKRGFNIFRWRHHCRICGKVFCNFCTPHRARVRGYLDLERICILCKSATLKSTRNMTIATSVVPLSNPSPVGTIASRKSRAKP